ncbi:MAG: hybrid sensor histidine kinase/response regulator [Lachnospiraceae bacterium]
MDNGHERRRAVQLMMLMSYTVIALVLFGESLLLGWDMSAATLFLMGGVACWVLHFTRAIPREQRSWLCVILTMLAFFFYGSHETSLFDLAPVMIGAMILFSAMELFSVIRLCVVVYYVTVCYTLIFVIGKNMEYTSLVVTRLLLHFLLVAMAAQLIKSNMRRRADARRELEDEVSHLEEINRRTENFLTNVSHELRTPINAVTGITAVMLKKENDDKKREDILAVQQAGQRLFGQIEDILDYTEIDTGRICVVEDSYMISSIVNDLVMGGQFEQKEHVPELIIDVDPKLPSVLCGDGRKIKKILKHVIGNAVKFTKTGGIYVYIFGLKKEYGINLCIRVSDTGEGISEEHMHRITEQFYQSSEGQNRKAAGLGLGLPIVQGMVSTMEGFMQIHSEVEKGTTVDISIPQKVVDETPGMVVENKDKLCLACYLRQEKYKVAEIRNYYNDTISHLAAGLDLCIHRVFDLEELKKLTSIYQLTHLLIGADEYGEDPDFYEQLAQRTQVVVVAGGSFAPVAGSRVFLMKKPFFSLPIINILNTNNSTHSQMWENMRMICPDVRVLVVDDEPMNLMVAQGILNDYRMEVKTAESGMEAIEICEKEDFDLLFLDHMMPKMDGVETLHHIKKLMDDTKRDITAIAFTANAVSGAREMFFREGFDEFISKPIETLELERVLRKVLPRAKMAYVSSLKLNRGGINESRRKKETSPGEQARGQVGAEPEKIICEAPSDWLGELREAGVNTAAGLQYSCEDAGFYRQIVEKFMEDHDKNEKKLSEFYADKDWGNYRICVHALKSTSKMIGADSFSEMARCAEEAAKNLDETYLDTHHKELSDAYGRLTGMLKAVLAPDEAVDVQTVQEQASMQSAISREELCSDLAELSDCLKTFEADRAEEIIKKLQGLSCDGQPVSALLEDIRSDIDNFEMDVAEKKVQDLIREKKGGEE